MHPVPTLCLVHYQECIYLVMNRCSLLSCQQFGWKHSSASKLPVSSWCSSPGSKAANSGNEDARTSDTERRGARNSHSYNLFSSSTEGNNDRLHPGTDDNKHSAQLEDTGPAGSRGQLSQPVMSADSRDSDACDVRYSLPGERRPSAEQTAADRPPDGVGRSGREEAPDGPGPTMAWDPDVAAHCERVSLAAAPRLPAPAERDLSDAEAALLRRLRDGELEPALRAAGRLQEAGRPPGFSTLALLAQLAAGHGRHDALEAACRLADRLYPDSFARAGRLRHSQLELLWRRRLFAPACSLLVRRGADPVGRQLMQRRFAVCCCLAEHHQDDEALPHIKRASEETMRRGTAAPLLSAWQHCFFSERHSYQQAAAELLRLQPAARPHLAPYVLRVVEEAQLAGREDVLRRLPELALSLGETRLYPLVFGALLDFQCLVEDVWSAQETVKLAVSLSIRLPSTVVNRYFSLLQRYRLKAPAALLSMKYRSRPPDGSVAPPAPSPPVWWDKW